MNKIILAGGTGNLGNLLVRAFLKDHNEVVVLSRSSRKSHADNLRYVQWDGESLGDWVVELETADTIINLSGKSIQCRFTDENKKLLHDSRIKPTQIIGQAIQQTQHAPRLWINFSGISLFEGLEQYSDEHSTRQGMGFLAALSAAWESAFQAFDLAHTRQVILRVSPVLAVEFGMFKELYPLTKLGLGGQVGDGQQQISWITDVDFVRLVLWLVDQDKPSSIYHACVPEPSSNTIFMSTLRDAIDVKIGLPLPKLFAKIGAAFKGVEPNLLLATNAVRSVQARQEGFEFAHPDCLQAFQYLIHKTKSKPK